MSTPPPATPATPATKTVKSGDVTHSTGINALVMKADDQNKYFYVDTYINTNKVADTNGILNGHLFQFTTKSNGTLDAVEVATGTAAKLYNLADVAVSKNTQVYGGATGTLVVNSNTVFWFVLVLTPLLTPIPLSPSPASPTSTTMPRAKLTMLI